MSLQIKKFKALIAADIATAELAYTDATARWRHQRDLIQPKAAEIRQTIDFASPRWDGPPSSRCSS